jgi:hypothetical protein
MFQMKNDGNFPTKEQVDNLIDRLLPANEDLDAESAAIILEREDIDRAWLASALKRRLEARLNRMREAGEDIPSELVTLMNKL